MNRPVTFLCLVLFLHCMPARAQEIITSDIDNFWAAYDKITLVSDSSAQYKYLQTLYLDKASPGLKALIEVRRYQPAEFIHNINSYPFFWQSIRKNTLQAEALAPKLMADVALLKKLYPALKPATIYFSIGAFRSNGTIQGKKVLIGAEMAMSDKSVNVSGLPEHLKEFNTLYTPINDLGLLCTHEYVHTQQKELAHNLLSYCIYEGIAEFISTLATGKVSYLDAIAYGREHYTEVRDRFEQDVFVPARRYHWLWSTNRIFGYRDLGYSVGFEIASRYYSRATDKAKSISEMITLDFANEQAVEQYVDKSGYLSKPLQTLYDAFERSRPTVTGITQFENGSAQVSATVSQVTLHFSEAMDPAVRGFDFGPLGEKHVLQVQKVIGFSDDRLSFTFEVKLEPGKRYQSLVTNRFTSAAGIPLKAYLIHISTAR